MWHEILSKILVTISINNNHFECVYLRLHESHICFYIDIEKYIILKSEKKEKNRMKIEMMTTADKNEAKRK